MAGKKEYELALKIVGMVDKSLDATCNLTKKQIRAISKEAANASSSTVSISDAMTKAGPGIDAAWNGAKRAVVTTAEAMLAAGAAVSVVGGLAINAGSDFESAFAGVKKTVDATDEQFADLEEGLREMAKNKPQTAVELAEIAEAAGQLGIHTENIEDFTRVMADLKVATNLGDEGASQFAKFANIVNMSQDKFENLGSTVVDLGNHMATTEADIVNLAMRLAGAGTQVGMSEADIMGYAAALSSVGIEAEMGGSAFSKLMINMQAAVETGDESLKDFAKVSNMSTKQFKDAFKTDAAGAISAFLVGLGDTERLGKSAIVTLDDMGMSEVRLRDTLLRATNASGLFGDAVAMANTAFTDNTALSKEAEQRYITFESRLGMVKNRVTDIGISLYQDFRDPLSDCLDMALDFTDQSDLFDADYIKKMAQNFQKNIPTVIRNVEDATDALGKLAEPVIRVGTWMMDNPDVIAGGLAAIGTTIITLKVAKTLNDTATAMNTLRVAMMSNPVTAALGIAALAGGAIAGVAAKVKVANTELKKQNLEKHFGNISLSLGELEDAAQQIIGTKTLDELAKAMEEVGKVSDLSDDINSSANAIDKLTWKIGMGLKLSETEQGQFDKEINSMIDNSIALVEQAQYTARLNVNALFGEGDETGSGLIAGFDAMYQSINTEVADLGKRLGNAYNNAMEDGIIDTDEAKLIQELQEQLGRVTEQVAQSQLDAKMERIHLEYSGKELDADTFQNLQNEMQSQINEAMAAKSQSYEYTLGALNLRLERSQSGEISEGDAEYITQQMYNDIKTALDGEFMERKMELQLKGLSFQTQSINDAFQEDLQEIVPQMGDNLSNAMNETLDYIDWSGNAVGGWSYDQVAQWLNLDSLDKTTKAAIKDLWENMQPQFQDLLTIKKQYEEAGEKVPKYISEGISNVASIGIIAGSTDALYEALGNTINESQEFQETLSTMEAGGTYIPDAIADGINQGKNNIDTAVESLYEHTKSKLNSQFSKMSVNTSIDLIVSGTNKYSAKNSGGKGTVAGHAEGGIFDTPHFGLFAEEGAEAFIPLDRSKRSLSIWKQAGEILGISGGEPADVSRNTPGAMQQDNRNSSITYAPTYQIYGADEDTVRRATEDDFERFAVFTARQQRLKL